MSITHPIGYPITHPTVNPKGYPNRGRIARIDSGRIESCRFHLLGSPSIHNVTQVTRETAPEQTVTPADEWMEHFDFEAEVPCTHSWHQTHHDTSQPASYILHVRHSCGWGSTYPICKSGWAMFTSGGGYRCLGCAGLGDLSSVTIVEVLR